MLSISTATFSDVPRWVMWATEKLRADHWSDAVLLSVLAGVATAALQHYINVIDQGENASASLLNRYRQAERQADYLSSVSGRLAGQNSVSPGSVSATRLRDAKVASQVASWDRTQGHDKMQSMLQANPNINAVIAGTLPAGMATFLRSGGCGCPFGRRSKCPTTRQ